MKKTVVSFLAICAGFFTYAQVDILDLRTNFNIDDEVTITGIVTNGPELGTVRYIEDGTAGIAIYPGGSWDGFPEPVPGDEITVTGPITQFNGLLEVGSGLVSVAVNSSGNALPEPQVLTPAQINESTEGELVRINLAQFVTGGSQISGNSDYDYTASGEQGIIYVRNENPLVGQILPAGTLDMIGIVSQFTFDGTGGYQLLPRTSDDLILASSINLASAVDQSNITTTSFDLSWNTDASGNSIINYGLTPALGTTISNDTPAQSHSISLTDLAPGTIYYAQAVSQLGEDETSSGVRAFATVSESSGDITVYFNNAVDTSVATEEEAIGLGTAMNDTIAAYIDRANISLDCAIYNVSDNTIIASINDALDRGVQIRYIAQGSNLNIGLEVLNDEVPVLFRTDSEGSGMHNKFVIIDAEDVDNSYVLGGSTNWTEPNLSSDYNNLIIFQDQSIAKGYTLEFQEMWGTDGAQPDTENSKFGSEKTINTPEKYIIGGSPVEVYFSPTDNTTVAIIEAMETAEYDLDFAVLSFTRNDIRDAIIEFNSSFFTTARGVMENIGDNGSEFTTLQEAGVEIYSHQGITYQVHHKLCIIDHSQPEADPLVVTGSHNWSSSAENVNDENTVVVHDARVANLYFQEWWALFSTFLSVDELGNDIRWAVYPNPTSDLVQVDLSNANSLKGELTISDAQGRMIQATSLSGDTRYSFDVSAFEGGVYYLTIRSGDIQSTQRFVKR